MSPEPIATQEDIDEAVDDIDTQLVELLKSTEVNNAKLLEGINSCQTRLESLTEKLPSEPMESPMLREILSQLTELRNEVTNLKSSTEAMAQKMDQVQRDSSTQQPAIIVTESVTPNPENQTEEALAVVDLPEQDLENESTVQRRRTRFV